MNSDKTCCDIVSKIPLLAKYCTLTQKSFLNKHTVCYKQRKDDIIFLEHFPASQVFFVLSGIIGLWKENAFSKKQYIRFVKEGELFGFRGGLMENNMYRLSASAFEDSEICYILKEDFAQVLKENPELHFNILLSYVKELEKIEFNYCNHITMDSREKTAGALLTIYNVFGGNGGNSPFRKSISRKNIADIAGISEGKTINLLTEFRKEKIIGSHGNAIVYINPCKLKEIVARYY